jgi:hypothetical protein
MSKEITLAQLPEYSPWPARLLGRGHFTQKEKRTKEIIREYDVEKWGSLLKRVRSGNGRASLQTVDRWFLYQLPDTVCYHKKKLILCSQQSAHQKYMAIVRSTLRKYLDSSAIVELGCGYGSIILKIAKSRSFYGQTFLAGEYTRSGVHLTKLLAKQEGLRVHVDYCNFRSKKITPLPIPAGAIIFTSFATPYIRRLNKDFTHNLSKLKPKVVIHFEPCYEHYNAKTLLGLMQKRYIEINDYNTNLLTALQTSQWQGAIEIIEERPLVFGQNPFLVSSVLAWKPASNLFHE